MKTGSLKVVATSPLQAGSQWAHALNTIKMADGFAKLGHDVTLITRSAEQGVIKDEVLRDLYGITPALKWIQLKTHWFRIPIIRAGFTFSYAAYQVAKKINPDLVYARDFYFPWLCSKNGIKTTAESHASPGSRSRAFDTLAKGSKAKDFAVWVTISKQLKTYYASRQVPPEKIQVLPDAVDFELFRRPKKLPDSPFRSYSGPHIVYAGHLYDYKGIPTIIECARHYTSACFHLVGGWPEDIARHREYCVLNGISNVVLHGLVPHAQVPGYLWHADVLLLVPSARHPSAAWTSPVKLGEYLASGTPVVSSDIPALRTWLTENETIFVQPDNAAALQTGIYTALENPSAALTRSGLDLARTLTYEKRANAIISKAFSSH